MLRGSRCRLASTAGLNPSLYTGGTQPEAMFGDGTGGKPPAPPLDRLCSSAQGEQGRAAWVCTPGAIRSDGLRRGIRPPGAVSWRGR